MKAKEKVKILESILFGVYDTKEDLHIIDCRLNELKSCLKSGNKRHISNGYRNLNNYKAYRA